MLVRFAYCIASTLIVTHALAVTGCSRATAQPTAAAPVTVTVSKPVEREVADYADFTARLAAVKSVEIRARVPGYIETVNFKEGAIVKKGDVLYVLDQRPYVAEVDRARAQLEQSKASLNQAIAQLSQAEAQVDKGAANLTYQRKRLDRSKQLAPRKYITQEELDQYQSDTDQTEADLAASKAQVGSSRAAVGTAKAAVQAAEAALATAELNLEYTTVIAPISGRISRTQVTEGNLVQAGDQASGTLLTTLVSIDRIYVYFDVDERTIQRVRQLQRDGKMSNSRTDVPVSLGLATEEGFPHQGTINFVDNQVNAKTGTLRVRGVFANADESLSPGFFARVRVSVGPPHQALLVTDRALDNDQGQRIVYVLDDNNEVDSRPVRIGALHDGLRAIEDGLKPGEQVIVSGIQQVRPGVTVEPKLVDMPAVGSRKSEARSRKSEVGDRKSEVSRLTSDL
jgi:RND family efflux transporter MFP subunit